VNIVLVGFSGSGKTTVGKEICKITGMDYIDTDVLIERKLSLKIEDIFRYYGHRYFRYIEREVIKNLLNMENKVIGTGGGAFINPTNILNLKSLGIVFFLNATLEKILTDDVLSSRPLLKNEDMYKIQKLYESRLVFYREADFEINIDDKSPNIVAKEIINIFCSYKNRYDNIKESFK